YRFQVDKLDPDLMEYKYNSGFFFEYDADELGEILPACNEKCQTLTYLGVSRDELTGFISKYAPKGVDRMVPIGKSMDFGLIWDGYDLIRTLSRRYVVE
ncbi:MAG: acyl-CoA reductase, partial [Bacillota bacterium]